MVQRPIIPQEVLFIITIRYRGSTADTVVLLHALLNHQFIQSFFFTKLQQSFWCHTQY